MKYFLLMFTCLLMPFAMGDLSEVRTIRISRGLSPEAQKCVECHATKQPGIVNDWKQSRHAHVGVSCLDCHFVTKDNPMAAQNCEGVKGTQTYLSPLVSPNTCARCHAREAEEFNKSGHWRSYLQIKPKKGLHQLVNFHEGRQHPKHSGAPWQTGCMQCHGTEIKLDENKRPTPDTWPNYGMGNVYPDGGVGNCATCHTRHAFKIVEARHPRACASCHLGPDHPDIEIYENSKHGHVFLADPTSTKNMNAPAGAWEPGDFRAPTCATCHMSGIGGLDTTHNISDRLHWNLWAERSNKRNSPDPMSALTGNAEEGRKRMKMVCKSCHSTLHTEGFFKQGDNMVELYNNAYYDPAKKMYDDLKSKGLLMENPWLDPFEKTYYHLWHHEGRRMRQGAMMGAPDYAHWHGVFEVQQDMYELEEIYNKRIKSGKIEH